MNLLPIFAKKKAIIEAILESRVVFIQGETGSGKTTQVPQYVLEAFPGKLIGVTQPRRVAAINLAARVS
jgi:HrpA-like RNA helicase